MIFNSKILSAPYCRVSPFLTEEELLVKAAAEASALVKGISAQAADAANFVSFWPNQVLVSLVALAILVAVLLPQKLADR